MTRRALSGRLTVVVVAALLTWSSGSPPLLAAEIDPVALVWTAPQGCPAASAVHDEVEKTLGVSIRDLAPVAAVVTVAHGAGNWQAKMILHSRGERSERAYDAESCDALAAATALMIALAAEGGPGGGAEGRRVSGAQSPEPGEPPSPDSKFPRDFLQLGGGADWGTMPRAAGAVIEAGWVRLWASAHWRLRASATSTFFWPEYGNGPSSIAESTGWYWALALGARACATAALSRFEIGPCLAAEVTAMHATHIAATSTSDTKLWLSPSLSALAALTVSAAATVFVRIDEVVPTTHPTFSAGSDLDGTSLSEHGISSHAIRGLAGIELRFL